MGKKYGDTYLGISLIGAVVIATISGFAGLIGLLLGEWIGFGLCMCASVFGYSMLFQGLLRN